MNKIKVIIFDFDGVIAESVNIKTDAFAELYRPYGKEIEDKVIKHHIENGGISRFEKFKFYHETYLNTPVSEQEIGMLSEWFSSLVIIKVIESSYVNGAFEFISTYFTQYDMYISSGTPEAEIKEISSKKGISKYFKAIYGSPNTKSVHVSKILKEHNYTSSEVLFIGDAPSDREAAYENGLHFIARVNSLDSPLRDEKFIIPDLTNLQEYIQEKIEVHL